MYVFTSCSNERINIQATVVRDVAHGFPVMRDTVGRH